MSESTGPGITDLARSISAEVRARMAAARMTQRQLADEAGFASHNYLSIRLRDERPLTVDDIERLARVLMPGADPIELIQAAWANHMNRLAPRVVRQAEAIDPNPPPQQKSQPRPGAVQQ